MSRARLHPPEGGAQAGAVYQLRQGTVEPVFGQGKEQQGSRRFLLRGRRGAWAETFLVFLTYHLRKLFFTFRGRVEKLWLAGAAAGSYLHTPVSA
ncbi:MAG: transposase [Chloroflexi bacterium]|nr:transposase [Chloroflexota bacterium]